MRQPEMRAEYSARPVIDLSTNTTDYLVRDMEQLRDHLGIEKWLLFGLSWGSVLSITYALRHPERVSELIVTAVATGRHAEIEWLIRGFGAADDWCAWEDALATIPPGRDVQHEPWEPRFQLAFARLVTHYFSNRCWLPEDQLARDGHALKGIPGVIVHGRLDLGALAGNPWVLHNAWPASELVIVENAAHGTGTTDAVIAATDRFATSRSGPG